MANTSFFSNTGTTASVEDTIDTSVAAAQAAQTAAEAAQAASETAQTASETAQTASETAKTASETARNTALSHKTDAESARNAALGYRNTTETYKDAAATSATSAASSLSSVQASASAAATSETNAATSETNAATSETNAASSATSASSSASSASTSASTATTKASEAATSATNAATSETNASSSATSAASSASTATTKAAEAATSASNAASSATSAASSASSASSAQTAAESARDSALAAYDSFDDRYLGVFAAVNQPTTDNDGNALVAGSLFFDSTAGAMKVYTGSTWVAAYISGDGFAPLTGATFTGSVTVPNLITSGNVDGRDVSVDGAKLDGIESGATADQTAGEIKTAYESNLDTNAFTDALLTKLTSVEASATADQSASEILTAIKTVDGASSGLDADLLDGQQGSYYLNADNFSNMPAGYTGWTISDGMNSETIADGNTLTVSGTGATTASYNASTNTLTINSTDTNTDTNTTYTAGSGLSLSGTTFSHTDTSSQASVNNSGRTYIQDITLDTYGHVTGITSATETVTNTDTTYSAGSGLDLSGTTFSVESDLRDGITHVGLDTGDYIAFTNNARIDFVVNGGGKARIESDGDFHADGNIIAYSTTISDPRLKEDINPVEDALAKVNALTGYTFTYKPDGTKSAGVMSTEIKEVLPSAVRQSNLPLKTDGETVYDVVQYDQLHALLIEAIKELTYRVKELEAR